MPLDIQPYLLRVLEDRIVYRIGDGKGRPVDVDLVALTNRDLKAEVEAGRFRRDLYYRIGTVTISVPPLRERGDDVALLVEHFNRQIATQTGQEPLEFPDPVMAALLAYAWPGNVRELKNLIVRLHLVVRDRDRRPRPPAAEIAWHAPAPVGRGARRPERAASIDEATRQAVVRAIAAQGGNLSKVAQTLGISRPTLYRKLKLYGIGRLSGGTAERLVGGQDVVEAETVRDQARRVELLGLHRLQQHRRRGGIDHAAVGEPAHGLDRGDQLRRGVELGRQQRGQAHWSGTDDGDRAAGLNLAVEHAALEAGRQDIAQHDERFLVRAVGDRI